MIPEKPYALSCDRNSEPILGALKEIITNQKSLFEVGAGTGQHAIFMAPHFPNMFWTLADQEDRHEGINMWLKDFPRSNVRGPVEYSIGNSEIKGDVDVVFTANVIHIISWELSLKLFDDVSQKLPADGLFLIYGAFNYDGKFTSESNEKFEAWLKEKDPQSGIRDFEKVVSELSMRSMELAEDKEMPANNRLLVFKKK